MMGHGVEYCIKPKSEHARDGMETGENNDPSCKIVVKTRMFQSQSQSQSLVTEETNCEVVRENSVVVSKSGSSAAAASEPGFKAGNSMVVFEPSSHGSQCHVCRFCGKVFSSGKGLGGHVRIHGAGRSKRQSSRSRNVSRGDHSSSGNGMKKSKVPTSRSNGNFKWVTAGCIEEEGEEAADCKEMKNMKMDVGQEELSDHKIVSLYTLRRNPKRSRRLTEEEFIMDLTAAKNSRACGEYEKFPSSKSEFVYMRCHATDDDYLDNSNVGAIVVAAADPISALYPLRLQSSQGSEDLQEKGQEGTGSYKENNRESMKSRKEDHHPVPCNLLSWSVTAKRGRRRPIRSIKPQKDDDAEEEEAADVDDNKELEDDRDTAHFLVMLASSAASNTNKTNKVNRPVKRQMIDKSANHSNTGKGEARGSSEDLKAGEDGLAWKKKRRMKQGSTEKTSRPAGLGAASPGKYKCSTCNKLFKSHQALGGHRASQKGCFAIAKVNDEVDGVGKQEINEDGNSVLMIEYYAPAVDDMGSSVAREEDKRAIQVKKGKRHECCICHRVFPSGQALGGHKRSHWTVDRVRETSNNVTSTEKHPKLLKGQVRERLFDLNKPAPADEEYFKTAYDKVEVVPPFANGVNQRVKMIEAMTLNTGFRFSAGSRSMNNKVGENISQTMFSVAIVKLRG